MKKMYIIPQTQEMQVSAELGLLAPNSIISNDELNGTQDKPMRGAPQRRMPAAL